MNNATMTFRQGLPRVKGGDAWPPVGESFAGAAVAQTAPEEVSQTAVQSAPLTTPVDIVDAQVAGENNASAHTASLGFSRSDLRQGLPREKGGEPWPPRLAAREFDTQPVAAVPAPPVPAQTTAAPVTPVQPKPAPPKTPAASPSAAAATGTEKEKKRFGPFTIPQWVLVVVVGFFCAIGVATTVVAGTRWLLGFDVMENFIERYPGSYELPEAAPIGIPVWMSWQHFLNFFLIVLIIRAGLQVRNQKKPPAYWSSKRSPKVSINLWFHLALDVLWLVNGLIFVILLFATGHWMRIVPTSWEVFPNAVSAGLQYLSLDWPTENGWVHYNGLQELAYFSVVFIAAPLAAITGVRMSAYWSKNLTGLSRAYPVELARKLHFPTMLFFVVFIFIHVALVFSTGALRNLNHMYAAQGSVDPNEFASNWTGFWLFALSLVVVAAAWAAARPMFLTPIARLFGNVSAR